MSVQTGRLSASGVQTMFDRIAPVYDSMNHVMTAGLDRRWRRITAEAVVCSGHEVLDACCGTGDLAIAPVMSSKVGYDALRNFVPISIISRSPSVLLVHPSVSAKTVREFAALARADPAKYSYASMSLGQNLLNTERLFRLTLKLPIVRIPFPGAAPILSSTAAGHTLVAYIGLPPATPFIKEGTLQALAVTSPKRSPIAPDVPTMAESGLAGQETELMIGLVAPARTPPSIVDLLARRMAEFVARPQTQERLAVFGFTAVGSTPEEFAAHIKSDIDRAAAVVREAGIKVD